MGYTQPLFNVRKLTGSYAIYPDGVTTDDLIIYPNPVDTSGTRLQLNGLGSFQIYLSAGTSLKIYDAAVQSAEIYYDTANNQFVIENKIDTKDLYLKTTGTGVLKFGTHTASGDAAVNGYITVKDAGGTSRRLATIP